MRVELERDPAPGPDHQGGQWPHALAVGPGRVVHSTPTKEIRDRRCSASGLIGSRPGAAARSLQWPWRDDWRGSSLRSGGMGPYTTRPEFGEQSGQHRPRKSERTQDWSIAAVRRGEWAVSASRWDRDRGRRHPANGGALAKTFKLSKDPSLYRHHEWTSQTVRVDQDGGWNPGQRRTLL